MFILSLATCHDVALKFGNIEFQLTGSTVVHPMLDNLMLIEVQPLNTNITHFENVAGFDNVLRQITRYHVDFYQ